MIIDIHHDDPLMSMLKAGTAALAEQWVRGFHGIQSMAISFL
jgi:hypothetical protein